MVDALLEQGVEVTALARTDRGAWALRDRGATTIRADIGESIQWDRAAEAAEVIFHLGLPRITPPVRGRHLRKLEREAQAGAEIAMVAASDMPMPQAAMW